MSEEGRKISLLVTTPDRSIFSWSTMKILLAAPNPLHRVNGDEAMAPEFGQSIEHVPLIPEAVLKKHACHEPLDTRFRSAARLLQSIWRRDRGLPMGSYVAEGDKRRKLGSKITPAAGMSGGNFLSPEIAHMVHREVNYREYGAMIEEERLYCNLLSSMPLVFNAFGPLKQELMRATSAMHELIPGFSGVVRQILFEHSPGRGNAHFTGDYSAFDLLMRYDTPEGRRGFIAVEMKYSESGREPRARPRPRYDELSESCGLFHDPAASALRDHPIEQLWRDHMLAQSMLDVGLYDEGCFILISPELNHLTQQAGDLYLSQLREPNEGKARFLSITLEQLIAAIRLCDPEHASALHRRYCDFWLVDGELELCAPKFKSVKAEKPSSSKATAAVSSHNVSSNPLAVTPI